MKTVAEIRAEIAELEHKLAGLHVAARVAERAALTPSKHKHHEVGGDILDCRNCGKNLYSDIILPDYCAVEHLSAWFKERFGV